MNKYYSSTGILRLALLTFLFLSCLTKLIYILMHVTTHRHSIMPERHSFFLPSQEKSTPILFSSPKVPTIWTNSLCDSSNLSGVSETFPNGRFPFYLSNIRFNKFSFANTTTMGRRCYNAGSTRKTKKFLNSTILTLYLNPFPVWKELKQRET